MKASFFAARSPAALSLVLAGLVAVMPGAALATDGYFLNGMGAKSKGAGGVAIAMPEDAMAIAANPAAATALGHRLDAGVELFIPRRGATISGNGAGLDGRYSGNGANPFLLPEVAYVRPLNDTISVGLAINGNGGMNTQYKRNPFARFGATGNAGVNLRQMFIAPTIAAEVAPGHSFGLSPLLMIQSFEMQGIHPFTAASADPGRMTNKGTDWAPGAGVRIGYLGTLGDTVTVGAFYQTKVWAKRFDKYAGLFAERGGFDVPASWGVGLSFKPHDRLTFGVDYKRIEYSGIKSVGTPLSPLFQGNPFGADNGPGFGWRDIDVFKFGAAYRLNDTLTVRAGYGHSENPVPSSETFLNILAPGVVKGHYTAGASLRLSPRTEITGYVMHAPRNTVRGVNSIPAPYGGGEADVRLSETSVGLSVGFDF